MKTTLVIALVLLAAGMVLFTGCDQFAAADHDHGETEDCMSCHSGSTSIGNKILVATAQYENSGHYLGPRIGPDEDASHLYTHHGSNAMYANGVAYGSSCAVCHTHQGFVGAYGTDADITNANGDSQIGCFTCHAPHETGDFSLRKETAVTLADETTSFNLGAGNLCANCHLARSVVADVIEVDADLMVQAGGVDLVDLSSHSGTHHGPMADMLMGVNAGDAADYSALDNDHAYADGCVSCHLTSYGDDTRSSIALGVSGHAFYLQGDVHGSVKDITSTCTACHDGTTAFAFDDDSDFSAVSELAEADWDGDTVIEDVLVEINGLKTTLLNYFGAGANFYIEGTVDNAETTATDDFYYVAGGDGDGPVINSSTEGDFNDTDGSSVWMVDWDFKGAVMTETAGEAFWSFKYFIEDKSGGIHNPRFAAQMLYNAADSLSLTVGTAPANAYTAP
jgi:hypothetical protein